MVGIFADIILNSALDKFCHLLFEECILQDGLYEYLIIVGNILTLLATL